MLNFILGITYLVLLVTLFIIIQTVLLKSNILGLIPSLFGLLLFLLIFAPIMDKYYVGAGCDYKTIGHSELYCYRQCGDNCYTNSVYLSEAEWILRNRTQEEIDRNNSRAYEKQIDDAYNAAMTCYNNGSSYNYSFDVIKSYNFSCNKLAYINDHLIEKSRQVDGGYISGSYSGFLSSGHVEGHLYQWVTESILATGQLIKNIQYHLDCNNQTVKPTILICQTWSCPDNRRQISYQDTKVISYYTESEFVMYYVDNCVR